MKNELMNRVAIDDICNGRNKAIAGWLAHFDAYRALLDQTAADCPGGSISLASPHRSDNSIDEMTTAFLSSRENIKRDPNTYRETKQSAREHFEELATQEIDRRCWSHLMNTMGFDQLMDRQARQEFNEGLKAAPPAFTPENCAATFGNLWENRRDIYLRGIANVFSALDRRFRSHDGFKVGARMIIEGAVEVSGWSTPHWRNYDRRDTFSDVERVFAELDGQPKASISVETAIRELRTGDLPTVVHGDYFRVRVFKNGNLHIWFERDDLLQRVNKLLAEYYGEVIGDAYDTTEADDAPEFHLTPAKNHGAFNSSAKVADRVAQFAQIHPGDRVLEPSAGTGMLAKMATEAGAVVSCIEIQEGLAHELRVIHGLPHVHRGDFLKYTPAELGLYDVIVMNPPFDRGRDCDHVRHAFTFLKPGGKLVAIMSARAEYGEDRRHKALHTLIDGCSAAYGRDKWHDLPAGSFAHAGSNVNTVILAIRKPS